MQRRGTGESFSDTPCRRGPRIAGACLHRHQVRGCVRRRSSVSVRVVDAHTQNRREQFLKEDGVDPHLDSRAEADRAATRSANELDASAGPYFRLEAPKGSVEPAASSVLRAVGEEMGCNDSTRPAIAGCQRQIGAEHCGAGRQGYWLGTRHQCRSPKQIQCESRCEHAIPRTSLRASRSRSKGVGT